MSSKVVVVGSVNVDLSCYIDAIPLAGETKRGLSFKVSFGGKGANQAVMAARCGVPVSMITGFGRDENGESCKRNFEDNQVDFSSSFDFPENTGVAHIWIEQGGENRIVIIPGANERLVVDEVTERFVNLEDVGVVLSQLETPLEVTESVFIAAQERGITTILNPAPFRELTRGLLENTDWLVVNELEYELMRSPGFKGGLIITLGEAGAVLQSSDGERVEIPGRKVLSIDTVGAGDCLIGAFAAGISLGLSPKEALTFGLECAAISVTREGAQASFPSREEAVRVLEIVSRL